MPYTGILFGLILFLSPCAAVAQHIRTSSNRLIVKTKKNQLVTQSRFRSLLPESRIRSLHPQRNVTGKRDSSSIFLIEVGPSQDLQAAVAQYLATGLFEYAEPDGLGYAATLMASDLLIPNDPYFNRQWSHQNDGSFPLSPAKADADIDLPEAWNITTGDPQIIVAILDSGVKPDHPEFAGRLWINSNEIAGNAIDDDHNGYVDDVHGWNFVNDNSDINDKFGHGTHVTGIVGANGNNANGYAGVDWNCRLMICTVLKEDYSGFYSWWIEAIHYAVDHGARVISMSLGGFTYSKALEDAVNYAYQKNVLVVASMQNNGAEEIQYPAGYAHATAVGSTDPDDRRSTAFMGIPSYGSNYGNHLDVVAPGNFIYGLNSVVDTNFNTLRGGTSQATPLVSGLAALLWAQDPRRDIQTIENLIYLASEDEVGDPIEDTPGWDPYYGYGRINAYRALTWTEETQRSDELAVYPNPFVDEIHIKCTLKSESPVSIYMLNSLGQRIAEFEALESARTVDVTATTEDISSGLYFLCLQTNSTILIKKMIKY